MLTHLILLCGHRVRNGGSYLHCELLLGYKGELGRGIYTDQGMSVSPGRTAGFNGCPQVDDVHVQCS